MVLHTIPGDKHGQSIDNRRVLGILESEKALLVTPRRSCALTFWCHYCFHWKQCYSTFYLCAFLAVTRGTSLQRKLPATASRIQFVAAPQQEILTSYPLSRGSLTCPPSHFPRGNEFSFRHIFKLKAKIFLQWWPLNPTLSSSMLALTKEGEEVRLGAKLSRV